MAVLRHIAWLAMLCAVIPTAAGAAGQPPTPIGTWVNPRNSVKVQTGECNRRLCGWVVWANAEAVQDARDGGVDRLIGKQLLQDYQPTDSGRWTGHVFVPDLGRTFYSTITQIDASALKISGCILGGWMCKSQVWHRA